MKANGWRPIATAGVRLMALAILLTSTACSNGASYTYVDVHVTIDTTTLATSQLYLISTCEVKVLGADVGNSSGLGCVDKMVTADVGTFQWSSTATSGTLQFVVSVFDGNHAIMGQGTSDPVPVSPGKRLQTSVVVLGVAPPEDVDGGPGDDAGDDGASDDAGANVTTDASSTE